MPFSSEIQPTNRYKGSKTLLHYTLSLDESTASDLTLLSEFMLTPRSKVLRKLIKQAASAIKLDIETLKKGV